MGRDAFLEHFKKECAAIDDTSCHFLTVFSLAFPDGTVVSLSTRMDGMISMEKFGSIPDDGYPLSSVFVADGIDKTWAECTNEEKKELDSQLIKKVSDLLYYYDEKIAEFAE